MNKVMRFIKTIASTGVFVLLAFPAIAQGLGGPSSVQSDLQPGDGLTDPHFRSDFPRNVAPGWFAWKDKLAERDFRFNLDYLALGQSSNADLGPGEAASGIFWFYGNWKATENGSLTFKVEHRHAYTEARILRTCLEMAK